MISYFKYTDGNAFTLDGQDYRGMLNVIDNEAFTGAIYSSSSKILSSKGNFYSSLFLTKENYINAANTSLRDSILPVNIYPRSILTINSLLEIFETLNSNNIKLYKAGLRYDPLYYNIYYRETSTLPSTYCLSAYNSTYKCQRLPLNSLRIDGENNSDLFTLTKNQEKQGSLFISLSDSFKYYNNKVVASGIVNALSSITFNTGITDPNFSHEALSFDKYNELIYQSNDDSFNIFTYDFYSPNNQVYLVDRISTTETSTVTNKFNSAYGSNYRSVIVTDQGLFKIEIYSLKDFKLLKTLTPELLKLNAISKIAQRFEDDLLVVLGYRNNELILQTYDIVDLLLYDTVLSEISITNTSGSIESNPDFIELSNFDSDIIFFKYYSGSGLSSIQFRSLTSSRSPLVTYSFENLSINSAQVNNVINEINQNIQTTNNIAFKKDVQEILDIKFYPTDSINNIIFTSDFFRTDNYSLIDNIVPLSLKQNYTSNNISDNSLGLTLNSLFKSIIQDTITLYYIFSQKFTTGVNQPTYLSDLETNDFYLYGNESINVSVLNRVLKRIYDVQYFLASTITMD